MPAEDSVLLIVASSVTITLPDVRNKKFREVSSPGVKLPVQSWVSHLITAPVSEL